MPPSQTEDMTSNNIGTDRRKKTMDSYFGVTSNAKIMNSSSDLSGFK
jgi:hypothetical protein